MEFESCYLYVCMYNIEEEIAVVVKNMSTSWDDQAAKLVLHDINISVTKVCIVYTVHGML